MNSILQSLHTVLQVAMTLHSQEIVSGCYSTDGCGPSAVYEDVKWQVYNGV